MNSLAKKLPPRRQTNASVRSREWLTIAEVNQLREAARFETTTPDRDELIIALSFRHGLRVSELLNLKWADICDGTICIPRLKGGETTTHRLELDEKVLLHRIKPDNCDGFIFRSRGHRFVHLNPRHIRRIVADAGVKAGFEFTVHPHMLRHAKIYQLINNKGADIVLIQAYVGHRNISSTMKYVKVDHRRFAGLGAD